MGRMRGEVLLLGSVPLASVDEVFRACAREVGPYVSALPDGEVGERTYWIFYLQTRTYLQHPDLEAVTAPHGGRVVQPERGAPESERQAAHSTFRIRPGVASFTFPDLHYASEAVASYRTFRDLRAQGVIPSGVRFQVCLPTTAAAIVMFFAEPADWPAAYAAYQDAIRREIDRMLEHIPAGDLVIQWDIATEVRDLAAGAARVVEWAPEQTPGEKWRRHTADLSALSGGIPEETLLGYHFCYGTWGGWPHSHVPDMELCTRLANEAVARAGRTVDYVHLPVMPDAGERFFEPLTGLRTGDARPYLGLVLDDGVAAFRRRVAGARRHLPDFGIASYCGFGRLSAEEVPGKLAALRECAEALTGS